MVVVRLCNLLRLDGKKKKTYGHLMVMCRMEEEEKKGEAAIKRVGGKLGLAGSLNF